MVAFSCKGDLEIFLIGDNPAKSLFLRVERSSYTGETCSVLHLGARGRM